MSSPTSSDIQALAKSTVAILKRHGLSSCLTGGAACALWGVARTPNDLDMVVMTSSYTQEEVKRLVAAADTSYYLVPSTNPRNTYKVLWHRAANGVCCKVDLLLPPTLNIPDITPEHVVLRQGTPVMPLLLLLLMKLQAWSDHGSSRWSNVRAKAATDRLDIEVLLGVAVRNGVSLQRESWLKETMLMAWSWNRVTSYVAAYPSSRGNWRSIGIVDVQPFGRRLFQ
ncbi:hypothetical protein FA95DRAFT_1494284 [Auriscalpium vulgare]|uniref:Uncharacterized protein n=1 Tax=Auriscalpium vulgare TaxID=40419 RepID=A0ACB8RQ99_9AGAM|nr:hypothetical protein FA95DRAFT_1494284 [Auriscalpium vulgare]